MGKYTYVFNGHCWWLKIESLETLGEYIEFETGRRKGIIEKDNESVRQGMHSSSNLAQTVRVLNRFDDSVDWFGRMMEDMHDATAKLLADGKTVYVNSVGGYCQNIQSENYCRKDEFVFPVFSKEDINIKRWPGGRHYYAYIGDVEIKDGNVMKWNMREDAEKAVMKYVTPACMKKI